MQKFCFYLQTNSHFDFQEAAANGLREALRSFGCHFTRKVTEPADMPVESSGFKMALQMDKHSLDTAGRMRFFRTHSPGT